MRWHLFIKIFVTGCLTLFAVLAIYRACSDFHSRTLEMRDADRTEVKNFVVIASGIFIGFQYYSIVCLNSLFVKIKEENLNASPSSQASNDNGVFQNQRKPDIPNPPDGCDNPPPYPDCCEDPPPYPADPTSHIAIPM